MLPRSSIEGPVGSMVSEDRLPQIVGPVWVLRLRCLLGLVTRMAEVAIPKSRS